MPVGTAAVSTMVAMVAPAPAVMPAVAASASVALPATMPVMMALTAPRAKAEIQEYRGACGPWIDVDRGRWRSINGTRRGVVNRAA